MIWALLAFLGIPIWLILGVLTAAFFTRRNFKAKPGVFPLRVRKLEADEPGRWSGKLHARWVHDVLLANKGIGLNLTDAYPIASSATADPPDPSECKGLGDDRVGVTVRTDSGTTYELGTARKNVKLLLQAFPEQLGADTNPPRT